MTTKLKVQYRKTEELIPCARNARTHSDEQIAQVAASIREFGFTNPILVDGESGVIAGHGRLIAAQRLGMDSVPTIALADMTEAQRRAYVITDNKLALNAGWNDELLALELSGLQSVDIDLALTGFSKDELEDLMYAINVAETDLPFLPDGEKAEFQQITFTLHDEQAKQVQNALSVSKTMGSFVDTLNENSNGNALSRICEVFLTRHE